MSIINKKITFYKYLIKYFIAFAFGRSYSLLFLARAVQGIGSACSSVAGNTCIFIVCY